MEEWRLLSYFSRRKTLAWSRWIQRNMLLLVCFLPNYVQIRSFTILGICVNQTHVYFLFCFISALERLDRVVVQNKTLHIQYSRVKSINLDENFKVCNLTTTETYLIWTYAQHACVVHIKTHTHCVHMYT